jgi:MGT family glycosyltransferase
MTIHTNHAAASIVFATTPADGHTVPALPIARALIERGHRIRWYAGRKYADRIRAIGAEYLPMSDHDFSLVGLDEYFPERAQLSGIAKLKFDMTDGFARPSRTHLADLRAALDREPADLIVGDTGMGAGPMLTELGGPPFVALGISVVGFPSDDVPPFGLGLRPTSSAIGTLRNRLLHTLVRRTLFAAMSRAVNEIRTDVGLPARDEIVFEYMLHAALYVQLGAQGFEYRQRDLPGHVRFVGPVRPQPIEGWTEPDWWSDLDAGRPVIVLNQGTVATDPTQLLLPGLAALAGEDALVIAVTGGRDPGELGPLPANARVERFIPFERLLPRADVLVTNGGFGAVQLALAAGVPIVAAGRTEDKVEVAARVAYSGVGLDLRTQTPRPEAIADGVRRVLSDDRYRRRARELQAEIASAGREAGAADHVETLLAHQRAGAVLATA